MSFRTSILALALALVAMLGVGLDAGANICALDPVPAASLLFPYVVFDYSNPTDGINTLLAITNMSSQAQIVSVSLWSDTGQRVLSFSIVLSGYDVETFSMRDILHYGILPVTGSAGDLVVDAARPPVAVGPASYDNAPWTYELLPISSGTDTMSDRCGPGSAGYPGDHVHGIVGELEQLAAVLRANQVATRMHNDCVGSSYVLDPEADWWELRHLEQPTWMYVTADVVSSCRQLFPDQPAYWGSGDDEGIAGYRNVLTGDVLWIEDRHSFAEAGKAVHIEADRQIAAVVSDDGNGKPITFAYRHSTALGAHSDLREPLPTAWAVRYLGVGQSSFDTHIRLWKGSTLQPSPPDLVFDEEGTALALDCSAYSYWAWDEDEDAFESYLHYPLTGVDIVLPNLFPLAVQEVWADELELPASAGWLLLSWPASNFDLPDNEQSPAPDLYQTWTGVRYSAFGRYSAFMEGTVVANYNCFRDQIVPVLGIGYDYVNGGFRTGE